MTDILTGVSFIPLILFFLFGLYLFVLGILLPIFVFRIYRESVRSNNLMQQLIQCVLNPEAAVESALSEEKIRELQASYRKRKK